MAKQSKKNTKKTTPKAESIRIKSVSSADRVQVPADNIVDLRSMVAKREAAARRLQQELAPQESAKAKHHWWQLRRSKPAKKGSLQPKPAPVLKTVAHSPHKPSRSALAKQQRLARREQARAERELRQQRLKTERAARQLQRKEKRLERGIAMAERQAARMRTAAVLKEAKETAKKAEELYERSAATTAVEEELAQRSRPEAEPITALLPKLPQKTVVQKKAKSQPKAKTVRTRTPLTAKFKERWQHIAVQYAQEREERLAAAAKLRATSVTEVISDKEWEQIDPQELPVFGFSIRAVLKPLGAFVVASLIVVAPASVRATLNQDASIEDRVTQSAEQAFAHLQTAGDSIQAMDFSAAEDEFTLALEAFSAAQREIDSVHDSIISLSKYLPGKAQQLYSGYHLIEAGEELAAAGKQISAALDALSGVDLGDVAKNEDAGLTSVLVVVHSALDPSVTNLGRAIDHLNEVNPQAVPAERRDLIVAAQETLPDIYEAVQEGLGVTELLLAFLGHESEKSYLVLFQNNYEIRPTGGFIGTIAAINVKQGVVTGIDIPGGGVYDVAGQVDEVIAPPEPLTLVTDRWNLQDSNWFAHFPSSAKKAQEFYELGGGRPVDGVIALVPSVIERMLDVTGPLDLSRQYGEIIDKDNFYDIVQELAEQKYDETRESKKIISDMTPLLFNQLFAAAEDPDGLVRILGIIRASLEEKDMLVFMNNQDLQEGFSEADWSGELKKTDRDYLAVIHANIAGGKSDKNIEETVKHTAKIQEDGSIIDTVTVTRVHKGKTSDPYAGVNNSDYVRLYVPAGSELIRADGFDRIDPALFKEPATGAKLDDDLERITGQVEFDEDRDVYLSTEYGEYFVIGGWMVTPVGQSSTISVEYRLPFSIEVGQSWNTSDRYSLLVQKQPGSFGSFLTTKIEFPDNLQPVEFYPQGFTGSAEVLLTQDYFTGTVVQSTR